MRPLYIAIGCLSVVLATAGIVVPGLPTTPFVLLASWCFYRSSPRLRQWLHASFLGKYIRDYHRKGGITRSKKAYIILLMTTMVCLSIIFFIFSTPVRWIVGIAGLIGCLVVAFAVPTAKKP